jgi:hypothetical protein
VKSETKRPAGFSLFTLPSSLSVAYAAVAFLFGVSLGERGELGVVQHVFLTVIPLATVVLTFLSRGSRVHVALTGALMLSGLLLGQHQFANAWDDCLTRAESVRTALLARQGDYPARLEDLPIPLPCRAGFRPTILHYLSNDRGFRLWFTNDRERHMATDRKPFG